MTDERQPGDIFEPDDPAGGFLTDQEPDRLEPGTREDAVLVEETPGATVIREEGVPEPHVRTLAYLDHRPSPGTPRPYHFPPFTRETLPNGLTVIHAHLPERPLLVGQLLLDGGVAEEDPGQGGVTVLAARALTEGTARRDAVELIEAAERLGAELHAEAGWDSVAAAIEVPRARFGRALALLAETVLEPAFPENEVARLRDERLNDLMQARADPRRRIERVFPETIYAPSSPYVRPLAGTEATVAGLDRAAVRARYERLLDPSRATFIVAGDLRDLPVVDLVAEHLGSWSGTFATRAGTLDDAPHPAGRRIVVVDRAGSPQSELRVGHVGLPRRIPEFHAVSVLGTILGGLFNSRLQRLLREERGYTYGVHAGFEMRRGAGPFAIRTAVQTEVTVPAIRDILGELERIGASEVEPRELEEARDYLIGVFPLRFEGPSQVVSAITGLVSLRLPDDELDRYRPAVARVTAADVLDVARRHVRPPDAAVVIVGDAARVEDELRRAGLGEVSVVRDARPAAAEA